MASGEQKIDGAIFFWPRRGPAHTLRVIVCRKPPVRLPESPGTDQTPLGGLPTPAPEKSGPADAPPRDNGGTRMCVWIPENVNLTPPAWWPLGADAWVLFRSSGTEPLMRIYCEASSPELVEELLESAVAFVYAKAPAVA